MNIKNYLKSKEKLHNKTKILKTNKGITLVTLIITIVVMLILLNITLNAAFGDGNFLRRGTEYKDKTKLTADDQSKEVDDLINELHNIMNITEDETEN